MKERKLWTKKEDDALIFFIQQAKIEKWCDIAKRMRLQFGKNSRNQKQCRDRYVNHLRLKKDKNEWGKKDEQKIIQLHKQLGNKWVAIAQHFDGVTQIFIKNQFYSRLRKSIRKINKHINESFKKQFREFKLNIIFRLASVADGKLQRLNQIHPLLNEYYSKFLYILISFASDDTTSQFSDAKIQKHFVLMLIKPLVFFERIFILVNKNRRRRSKPSIPKRDLCIDHLQDHYTFQQIKVQSQWDQKTVEISQTALEELEELINFDESNIVLGQEMEKDEKFQEMDLKRQNNKDKKNTTSVSEFEESSGQKNFIQIASEQKIQQVAQQNKNQKCMIQEELTEQVDEESLIIDIFYEQNSISMIFIDDGWADDSESDLYGWQK